MKKREKKKGFTLMELLATIVILSILMTIVIASVAKFIDNAHKKYYNSQESMMVLAGKEYFTNYRGQLPKKISAVNKVTLKKLVDLKYIDEIDDQNKKVCNLENSYVYVQKKGEEDYQYYSHLDCGDAYETAGDNTKPVIAFIPKGKTSKTTISVKMNISDSESGDLFYRYEVLKNNTIYSSIPDNSNNFASYSSVITISLGNELSEDERAEYQIIGYARDHNGNEKVEKSGTYIIDKNESPTIETFKVNSSVSDYNSLSARLVIKVHDNNLAGKLKICISNVGYGKSETCESNVSPNYNIENKQWTIPGDYNGATQTVYLVVTDQNGNQARKTYKYTVYKYCNNTVNLPTSTGSCSASCGGGKKVTTHPVKDKYFQSHDCGTYETKSDCNTMGCCSSTYTSGYGSWGSCNTSSGWGYRYRTVYKNSSYNGQSCSSTTESESCYVTPSTPTPPSPPPVTGGGSSSGGGSGSTATPSCTLTVSYSKSKSSYSEDNWRQGTATVTMSKSNASSYGMGTSSSASYNLKTTYSTSSEGSYYVYGYVKNGSKTSTCYAQIKLDNTKPYTPYHRTNQNTSCFSFTGSACGKSTSTSPVGTCEFKVKKDSCGPTTVEKDDNCSSGKCSGRGSESNVFWYTYCKKNSSKNTGYAKNYSSWNPAQQKLSCGKGSKEGQITEVYFYDKSGNLSSTYTYWRHY